jgi:hypothetical protein
MRKGSVYWQLDCLCLDVEPLQKEVCVYQSLCKESHGALHQVATKSCPIKGFGLVEKLADGSK